MGTQNNCYIDWIQLCQFCSFMIYLRTTYLSLQFHHEIARWSLINGTVLCPWARQINPCLVLVKPRKTHPNITEKLLTETLRFKSNHNETLRKSMPLFNTSTVSFLQQIKYLWQILRSFIVFHRVSRIISVPFFFLLSCWFGTNKL